MELGQGSTNLPNKFNYSFSATVESRRLRFDSGGWLRPDGCANEHIYNQGTDDKNLARF
jgi:hypothetical protein